MTEVLPLQPLNFPLKGQQLIEASAGTGKTYTITALYLRLLLGMGDIDDQPLGPEQILVVTFTEAATEELRGRIRSRMVETRDAFLSEQVTDPFLAELKRECSDIERAVQLLEQAVRQMDEASIFTIHGFCQRMLKQHAFESGSLFEMELNQDDESLLRSAVLDFWRTTVYPLPADISALVLSKGWSSPDALQSQLRGLLGYHGLKLEPDLAGVDLAEACTERLQQIREFKSAWAENCDDLHALISGSGVNKSSYKKNLLPGWLEKIDLYADSELQEPGSDLKKVLERFRQTVLVEKTTKGEAPQHALFGQVEALLNSEVPVQEILLSRALGQVRQRMHKRKQELFLQSFDDLLLNMHTALDKDSSGILAKTIRKQYPVALIDEFQDTDPIQYGIFRHIYADQHRSALVMIGDPKQAIYAFRGADIFTYIEARRRISQSYTLDTNWRSTEQMVAAVNNLFQHADSPFIYDQDIPFMPVKAKRKAGKNPAALTFWLDESESLISKGDYLQQFAQATAAQIDQLLCAENEWTGSTLQGNDIAVLVRDRFEADAVRRALAAFDRPSVYLSSKDSVFDSNEALELALILAAVENPEDEYSLRSALATDTIGLDLLALELLGRDETTWEAAVNEFAEYQQLWRQRGVLPMLHQFVHRRGIAQQFLATTDGERRLTNLLHIGELLQQASTQVEGSAGLLRWLNEQINMPGQASDEQILRLESERNLVTVVTVHKSKGLEYPIVFLPFASSTREPRTALYHADDGQTVLDITAAEESLAQARQEVLAEELRLLYVALTRSVYHCFVGVAEVKQGNRRQSVLPQTALGYLLNLNDASPKDALERLQANSNSIQICSPPMQGGQPDLFAISERSAEQLNAREFNRVITRDWRVSSYSGLSQHQQHSHLPQLPGLDLEVVSEQPENNPQVASETIFSFPRGAHAGTFLHSVFEEISFRNYSAERYRDQLQEQLQVAGFEERWMGVVENLVADVLQAPLNAEGLSLAQVDDSNRLVEMEFMLSAQGVDAIQLTRLIQQHDPLSAQGGALSFETLNGMLKGFIDLTFRHQGKYYLLDYKSNYLGDSVEAYSHSAMEQAMLDHRYDLQYQLYGLALHRLLKQRLPDYDFQQHFGGVIYLFLRGVHMGGSEGVFSCTPSEALIEGLDQIFRGGDHAE